MNFRIKYFALFSAFVLFLGLPVANGQKVLSPHDLLQLKSCNLVDLHPNGKEIIYSIRIPRTANETPGAAHVDYYRINGQDGSSTPLFNQNVKGSSPRFSPDGKMIAFIHDFGDSIKQIWAVKTVGGEPIQLSKNANDVVSYRWLPGGRGIVFLSSEPKTDRELELQKRGYDFIFYEENLKNNHVFLVNFTNEFEILSQKQLTSDIHVWDFECSPDGKHIAFSASEKNLIDFRYMFREIQIMNLNTEKISHKLKNVGKLGNYSFCPDGHQLSYTGALNINDHAVSQVFTYDLGSKVTINFTPKNFRGHISWVGWKNNSELICYSGEGVYPKLSVIDILNQRREIILDAANSGVIFGIPQYTADFKSFVFTGNTSEDISNLYSWDGEGILKKISNFNPHLKDIDLGMQDIIRYKARDGKEIEGLLIYPVNYQKGAKYPLILYVHGGPESHHSNGWLSRYSVPGQVMAGKGYLVAYINYRASTGYGVDFGMQGFKDPAGKEFDDLADGIEYLIREKGADRDRVGMAGGSYGGYASGWFATYYTTYVKAVCMFVGISNVVSKKGTTDIPYEELHVHSGEPLEEQWQMNLERSPVYWAHQSKTATLIQGGASDTRVHPSQSMELYRRMKMNGHPAVRLVQYPGEGHGNRNQVGQIDVLLRQIDWLDWYVRDGNPLDGAMPPLDISEKYGLDW